MDSHLHIFINLVTTKNEAKSQPAKRVSGSRNASRKQLHSLLIGRTTTILLRLGSTCSPRFPTQISQPIFQAESPFSMAPSSPFLTHFQTLTSCRLRKATHSSDSWTNSNGNSTPFCPMACPYSPPPHRGQIRLHPVPVTHHHLMHTVQPEQKLLRNSQVIRHRVPLRPPPHRHHPVPTPRITTIPHAPNPSSALLKSGLTI
jgi:hypothetical protein